MHKNCIVALEDSSIKGDRRADQFLDPAHVLYRLRRQRSPRPRSPVDPRQPSIVFVDRSARLRALPGRQIVDLLAVQPVVSSDLDCLKAIENVKFRQRDAVDAGSVDA